MDENEEPKEPTNWRVALRDYYSQHSPQNFNSANIKPVSALQGYFLPAPPISIDAKKQKTQLGRFPPTAAPKLLQPIQVYNFIHDRNRSSLKYSGSYLHQSDRLDEINAGLQFLEGLLSTHTSKSANFQSQLFIHQRYVESLELSCRDRLVLSSAEMSTIIETLIPSLLSVIKNCTELLQTEVGPTFSADSVQKMINIEDLRQSNSKSEDLLTKLETHAYSIIDRASGLSAAIESTVQCADELLKHCQSVVYLMDDTRCISDMPPSVCKLDMIKVDWSDSNQTPKQSGSHRSINYVTYMNSVSLPVCPEVFAFLQSPRDFAYSLVFAEKYPFAPREFSYIMSYLSIQHCLYERYVSRAIGRSGFSVISVIKQLILCNCSFSDKDCHVLAKELPYFASLSMLDLSKNSISLSGVTSIIAALFSMGADCQLQYWSLSANRINSAGAAVIAEALGSSKSLLRLEVLTLSNNNIQDKGLFKLLKSTMNPSRKAFRLLHLTHHHSAEDQYDQSEDEEDFDTKSRRIPTPKNCYFADYFLPILSPTLTSENLPVTEANPVMSMNWLGPAEEGFWLETQSNYSSSHEASDEEEAEEKERRDKKRKARRHPVTATERKLLPKLVKLLLIVRLKLVAVNAFLRLRGRGHILSALDVSDCGITKEALRFVVPALMDNTNIRTVDLSNNHKLLRSRESCKQMSRLLKGGSLKSVKLNHLGVDDVGLEELARGIAASPSLRSIELAGNHFGPTGATWLSSLSKQYYLDELEIRSSQHQRQAPFGTPVSHRRGQISTQSVGEIETVEEEESYYTRNY